MHEGDGSRFMCISEYCIYAHASRSLFCHEVMISILIAMRLQTVVWRFIIYEYSYCRFTHNLHMPTCMNYFMATPSPRLLHYRSSWGEQLVHGVHVAIATADQYGHLQSCQDEALCSNDLVDHLFPPNMQYIVKCSRWDLIHKLVLYMGTSMMAD